ncbi:SDR family oxidoreductase [Nakamurella sp. YIM 132087]|uniref:SDR family oxidoreductase n=1 Tax=Nakamurella alba TaxID=2665158 RepID=A0A7K1FEL9_9ACTN|nr:glucose 1-dehydrogenase [Nakamurella alba]MTD12555.1 SDR family oxidoreductase [Nakamurella alba]
MGVLEGTVAIVTGAGSGMGKATAQLFVEEGAKVVLFDISGEEETVAQDMGANAVAVHGDVSQEQDVRRMVDTAVSTWGRLDSLCNVAGIVPNPGGLTADHGIEDFDRVVAVNLRGTFMAMKFAIPEMIRSGGGSIVNWGSLASYIGTEHVAGYAASKGGITQITKTAAIEYATSGIRVNAIAPGMIDTPIVQKTIESGHADLNAKLTARIPTGVLGSPREAAQVALFLVSSASSYVNGVMIPVDAGYLAG